MTIRRRLFILLLALLALIISSILIFGFLSQKKISYLQTYGWSDPVTIYGPENRTTPPMISATFTKDTILAAWEDSQLTKIIAARSTDYDTWQTYNLTSRTDVNTQPNMHASDDGSVYLAWRGETSPSMTNQHKIYSSGILWTVTTDSGETWQEPRYLVLFQANTSKGGYTEIIYSNPFVFSSGDTLRIYYTSNQDSDKGWIWYRETQDQGETWTPPRPIIGSNLYHTLLLTDRNELLALRQRDDGAIMLTRPNTHPDEEKIIGYGWPSHLFEDINHTLWVVWDKEALQETQQTYILVNGTKKISSYIGNDIWISSSTDLGETWAQPARLTTQQRTERNGLLIQAGSGKYITIYSTYPTSSISPWRQAWRWSIEIKRTEINSIKTIKIVKRNLP